MYGRPVTGTPRDDCACVAARILLSLAAALAARSLSETGGTCGLARRLAIIAIPIIRDSIRAHAFLKVFLKEIAESLGLL